MKDYQVTEIPNDFDDNKVLRVAEAWTYGPAEHTFNSQILRFLEDETMSDARVRLLELLNSEDDKPGLLEQRTDFLQEQRPRHELAAMETREMGELVVADLAIPANIKDIIQDTGCETLDDLVQSDPAVLTATKGFGAGARRELELALTEVLDSLAPPVAEHAARFIDELRLKPETPESEAPVKDVRALTWAFENLKHKPSVRIMRCRLALDGGPRPKVDETASLLGVTRNAVTLADFKVTDWLRRSDSFHVARNWFNWVMSHSIGYVTYQELEALFDTRVSHDPGDLLTALRLLERVEGRVCPWTLETEDLVIDKEFLSTVKKTRKRLGARSSSPIPPAEIAKAISEDIGREMSVPTALDVAERIWLDQVNEEGVTVKLKSKRNR